MRCVLQKQIDIHMTLESKCKGQTFLVELGEINLRCGWDYTAAAPTTIQCKESIALMMGYVPTGLQLILLVTECFQKEHKNGIRRSVVESLVFIIFI